MKGKILITGGAGFIGSHIVELLLKENYQVTVYDNFSSGRKVNLKEVINDIELIEADILDYDTLEKATKGHDFVSHQAAQLEIFKCLEDPAFDLKVNTIGTLNVLRACVKNKVKKLINASSACVYGQAQHIPQDESHPRIPNWPYGVSKLAAEEYARIYQKDYGLDVVSLRYGIVYGPREWLGRVLTMFLRRVISNKELIVFGDGAQLRDFVYVKDVARLHDLCLEISNNSISDVYNVSTGIGTSIKDLAQIVAQVSNKETKVIFEDLEEGQFSKHMPDRKRIPAELKKMVLSNKRAIKELDWKIQVNLKQGIEEELSWISQNPYFWQDTDLIKV